MYEDQDYEKNVGIVQLYPNTDQLVNSVEYPAIPLTSTYGFRLEFDLLQNNADYVNVKYIHCNYDWSKSNLSDIQFLDQYNEFSASEYNFSQNTRVQYVNYNVDLPTPTKSGNYLVVACRDNNVSDILFSRRVLVHERSVAINAEVRASNKIILRNKNHQIEFDLKIKELAQINPYNDIKITLLQNHNWNRQISGLDPTSIRLSDDRLEYRPMNGENNFPGWNEFRYFDFRSTEYRGINVANIRMNDDRVTTFISLDKSRKNIAYSQFQDDLNGSYYLENRNPNNGYLQSEYSYINFELESEKIDGEVYITGAFNNWKLTPENKMTYDETLNSYKGQIFSKQGYYNYQYYVASESLAPTYLEGSHFQTENNYEILVYFRNPFNNYDQLVGYKLLSSRD